MNTIQFFFSFAVLLLLPTLVVQYACVMTLGFKPKYVLVYVCTIGGYGIALLAVFAFNLVHSSPPDPFAISPLVINVACFLGPSYAYGQIIENQETGSIGFSKGCILSLVQLASSIPVYLIVGKGIPWISWLCKIGQLAPYHCYS